jgi:hypothetical protein
MPCVRGDWQEVLRLFEAERDALRTTAQADTAEGPLPEPVSLGGRTLHRVFCTPAGAPDGALRFTDPRSPGTAFGASASPACPPGSDGLSTGGANP